jgi:legumain
MYDDIAHSTENPIPGKVFNQPDGKDVYHGCKASYTGSDVSAAKFLAVLTGDKKTAKGPVLRSSKHDNVFIYYADHGAPGLIAMPEDQEPVYAKDLNAALVEMKKKDMYNRLVFYLEACESGSMFKVRTRRGK